MPHNLIKVKCKNLHSILDSMLLLARVTGLLPIRKTPNSLKYHTSTKWMIVSIISFILYLASCYLPFTSLFAQGGDSIANLGNIISNIAGFGVCVAFYLLTVLRRSKIAEFLSRVHSVSSLLGETGVFGKHNLVFKGQIVVGVLLCVFISTITSSSDWNLFFAEFITNIILYTTVTLFINCCYLIYGRFKTINNNLTTNQPNEINKIRLLARCHDSLCDCCEILNEAYDFQLLFFVTVVFVSNLFAAFNNVQLLYKTTPIDEGEVMEIVDYNVWSFYTTTLLVFILIACSAVSEQANSTGKIIHKFLLTSNNERVDQMIKTFSLQVMHRRVRFFAFGMFPLDYSTIYSLVSAATTYIVILVQFDQAKPKTTPDVQNQVKP